MPAPVACGIELRRERLHFRHVGSAGRVRRIETDELVHLLAEPANEPAGNFSILARTVLPRVVKGLRLLVLGLWLARRH
jgi:hypothetical protein